LTYNCSEKRWKLHAWIKLVNEVSSLNVDEIIIILVNTANGIRLLFLFKANSKYFFFKLTYNRRFNFDFQNKFYFAAHVSCCVLCLSHFSDGDSVIGSILIFHVRSWWCTF
jgi:hypothetical protein